MNAEEAARRQANEAATKEAEANRIRLEQEALLKAAASNLRVEAVTTHLKLPDLWKEHPAAWFLKCEALFTAHRISADQTKFSHIVGSLDADTFIQLQDVIQSPPASGKYDTLKAAIISRFADSADRSLQRLLNEMAMGTDKPTQLLAKMRNLSNGRLSDEVLRIRWAALLPSHIQPLLKILPTTGLNELAILADRLLEGQGQVATISSPVPETCITSSTPSLQRQIDDLRTLVTALTTQLANQHSRGRPRSRSRSRQQRGSSPHQQQQRNTAFCYYHNRFGMAAKKCAVPCTFNMQGSLNP